MNMTMKKITMSILIGLQLTGCAQMSRLNAPVKESISQQEAEANQNLSELKNTKKPQYITESNVPFISKKVVSQASVESLPASFKEAVTVNETFTNLAAVGDYIYWKFGIPVFIDKKVSVNFSLLSVARRNKIPVRVLILPLIKSKFSMLF